MGKGDPDLVETDGVQDLEGLSHVDEVSGIVEVEEAASEFGRLEKKGRFFVDQTETKA
jgi:hypothetical protein